MMINFLPYIVSSILLILVSDSAHGPIWTESGVISGFGGAMMWLLTRITKIANTIVTLTVMVILTGMIVSFFGVGLMLYIDAFIGPYVLGLIYIPLFNLCSAIVVWGIFLGHNIRRFGSVHADYNDWDEYDRASNRGSNTTVIMMNGQRWSPFSRVPKGSLSSRTSNRASTSSRTSSNSSSSSRTSFVAVPFPISMASRNSSGSRSNLSSRSSRSSSGNSDWAKGLAQAGILLIGILVLVVYCFAAWKLNDAVMDYWDETYALDHYLKAQ